MHVCIIGNGIAGVAAALRLRELRPGWKITMISGESTHHWSRPALMYVFMGHMRYRETKPHEDPFWGEQRIDLVRDWVVGIDVEAKSLRMHRGPDLAFDRLLIATGSKSNRFGWKGQDLDGVQGLYGLMDLELLYENARRTRRAVIVGGGLIGIELAEMLHSRGIHVTFLVREQSYWDNVLPKDEAAMVNRVIRAAGIELELETNLAEIVDDGSGRACAVVSDRGERFECQLVGLTAGVSPNIDLVEDSPIETGRGVLVDFSFRTSAADVFAAGDCAELVTAGDASNLIQQVWYTGKKQGRVAGEVMAGEERSYDPGIWYNSAKFLELEYQTYGTVPNTAGPHDSLYWEHENHRQALRLVHDEGRLAGVNVLGMRYRHEVCERWIEARAPLEEVLERLPEANFDPEFERRFEPLIARQLGEALLERGA